MCTHICITYISKLMLYLTTKPTIKNVKCCVQSLLLYMCQITEASMKMKMQEFYIKPLVGSIVLMH